MDDQLFIMDFLMEDDVNLFNVLQAIVEIPGGDNNIVPDNEIPVYNEGYFEYIVPRYSIFEFKCHFRMNRENCQLLCELIAQQLPEMRFNMALEKKVLFFLWILSKQESFLAVSDRFGFSKGTGHYIFLQILSALTAMKNEFIQWPNPRRSQEIAFRVENRYTCILHNFVLNREMVDSDDEDEEFNNVNIEANDRDNDFEDADNSTIKRNYIATLL
ncbi:hypothetical protein NQ317_019835 [Molorchus minor]|uniref:Transposase Helix-turn-helix domain-containing protein n=1 Tax=Molorchus minor TaxID=1323400 RepID=A0ABQ9JAK7_9CUCU|nr:hypothetical protein NQ317_019835 [Molorchus minor]